MISYLPMFMNSDVYLSPHTPKPHLPLDLLPQTDDISLVWNTAGQPVLRLWLKKSGAPGCNQLYFQALAMSILSKETEALYANTQGIALSTSLVQYVFQ